MLDIRDHGGIFGDTNKSPYGIKYNIELDETDEEYFIRNKTKLEVTNTAGKILIGYTEKYLVMANSVSYNTNLNSSAFIYPVVYDRRTLNVISQLEETSSVRYALHHRFFIIDSLDIIIDIRLIGTESSKIFIHDVKTGQIISESESFGTATCEAYVTADLTTLIIAYGKNTVFYNIENPSEITKTKTILTSYVAGSVVIDDGNYIYLTGYFSSSTMGVYKNKYNDPSDIKITSSADSFDGSSTIKGKTNTNINIFSTMGDYPIGNTVDIDGFRYFTCVGSADTASGSYADFVTMKISLDGIGKISFVKAHNCFLTASSLSSSYPFFGNSMNFSGIMNQAFISNASPPVYPTYYPNFDSDNNMRIFTGELAKGGNGTNSAFFSKSSCFTKTINFTEEIKNELYYIRVNKISGYTLIDGDLVYIKRSDI